MLKLAALKKKKEAGGGTERADGDGTTASADGVSGANASSALAAASRLRLQRDITELDVSDRVSVQFPDANDLTRFVVAIRPSEGHYRGGWFRFAFEVPPTYPHAPPRVRCLTRVFHPNIDEQGNVCLNILREEWKPVLSLNSILYGLQHLFLEPNVEDGLNREAAQLLVSHPNEFRARVTQWMRREAATGASSSRGR